MNMNKSCLRVAVRLGPTLFLILLLALAGCDGSSNGGDNGNEGTNGEDAPDETDGDEVTEDPVSYTLTTDAGAGGTIIPSSAEVGAGETASFTVEPDTGYIIETITGCDGTLDGDTYTTGEITEDCEISAAFEAEPAAVDFLDGTYEGVMVSPKNDFFTDSTDITFEIDDGEMKITKDAFYGRTCELEGELTGDTYPLSGSGTFKCSDFTSGPWSTEIIAKTDALALIAEIHMDPDDGDAYTIRIAGFRGGSHPAYDPDLSYLLEDAELEDFGGEYDGRLQSFDSCAALSFSDSPTDLTIAIDGAQIELEQDAFFEGVCKYEGEIESYEEGVISAAGTFECSNFDEGTWSTERLVMTGFNSMFAELMVDVPSRGCDYTVRYLGFSSP